MIGIHRKEARLRYLQSYWTSKVRALPERDHEHADRSGALLRDCQCRRSKASRRRISRRLCSTNTASGRTPVDSDAAGVHGVRVTPHVFILPKELDQLVKAIGEIARTA